MPIQKAVKYQHKIRLGLAGPTGSGKTMSALRIAKGIADKEGGRIGVIDTEHGSASLYADEFDFDVIELTSFAPDRYVEAIHEFEQAGGYAVIIADSLTHAWNGKDGALEQVDRKSGQGGNSFTAWRDVTPQHSRLVEGLLGCKTHLIATLRSKMAYEVDTDAKTHKVTVRKLGLQPIQREGMEYEFDVFADLDVDNNLSVSKTRNKALSGYVIQKAGEQLGSQLWEWAQGAVAPERPEIKQALPPASPIAMLGFDPDELKRLVKDAGLSNADLVPVTGAGGNGGPRPMVWMENNPGKTMADLVRLAFDTKQQILKEELAGTTA